MTFQEERWESLIRKAEQIERTARRRAAAYSLIPIILAGLLLGFTSWQIQQADQQLSEIRAQWKFTQSELVQAQEQITRTQQGLVTAQGQLNRTEQDLLSTQDQLKRAKEEADRARKEADELHKQLDEVRKKLKETTEQLKLATDFSRYEFSGDWALSLKYLASRYPRQTELLFDIYELQRAPWNPDGFSPEEGFNSPSFAIYLLGKHGLITVPAPSERTQARLQTLLPPRSPPPRVGDVVFYPVGYTMFYFEDEQGKPFVIGMTPLGVLALKPDFARPLGYGATFPE